MYLLTNVNFKWSLINELIRPLLIQQITKVQEEKKSILILSPNGFEFRELYFWNIVIVIIIANKVIVKLPQEASIGWFVCRLVGHWVCICKKIKNKSLAWSLYKWIFQSKEFWTL